MPRILLIEDNEDMRGTLALTLRHEGFEVAVAADVAREIGAVGTLRKPFDPAELIRIIRQVL